MLPKVIDVTTILGERVVDSVNSWQTPDGERIVEHLAGESPNGDLLVFYWLPGQDRRPFSFQGALVINSKVSHI